MNVVEGYAKKLQSAIEDEDHEEQLRIIAETAENVATISESVRGLEQIIDPETTERQAVDTVERIDRAIPETTASDDSISRSGYHCSDKWGLSRTQCYLNSNMMNEFM